MSAPSMPRYVDRLILNGAHIQPRTYAIMPIPDYESLLRNPPPDSYRWCAIEIQLDNVFHYYRAALVRRTIRADGSSEYDIWIPEEYEWPPAR